MARFPHVRLKHINTLLFILIIGINSYIIAAPFWPRVSFWWQDHHTNQRAELYHAVSNPSRDTAAKPNTLIIPKMLLNQSTLEGPVSNSFDLLKQGVWRWPASSTPDKGGNTVFLAHRFSYTGPHGAFYYLNSLQIGDRIGVIWNNKSYVYSVVSTRTVPPTETSIEDNTADAQLTLFTCTPLWHPVNRLVVVAKLQGASS